MAYPEIHVSFRPARLVPLIAASLLFAAEALAQQWAPTQPIRVLIPYAPVGTSDIIARIMSDRVAARLGQPFVIENRPGGSTQIATEIVAKSKPDGHTLLLVANTFMVNPSLFSKLPYDSDKDLTAVTYAGVTPHTLVVNPALPVKNLKEFVAYAKANPGRLSYGSVGNGTSFHLGMEMLKKQAGIFVVHIPYKGMGPVLTDLLSNQIQVAFANTPNAVPHVQGGKLRAIAMAHPARMPQLPDVATIDEQGIKGFESNSAYIFLAPGATPVNILERLHSEFAGALKEPALRSELTKQGVEVMASSRAETTAFIKREMAKYAEAVKFSGAQVD
jgi:tripartite-type tricarboxylate transporter receptor subunit TctC